MKKISGILILIALSTKLFAGSQVPDICIFQKDSLKDTLSTYAYPLETYLDQQDDRSLGGFKNCNSPACVRGYQAVWLVKKDSLFLINIQGCNEQMSWCDESAIPSLKNIFGESVKNKRVFANWVNGNYRFFKGNEIPLLNKPMFESEKQVAFKNGKAKRIKHIRNVIPRRKAYKVTQNTPEMIVSLMQSDLDWHNLPESRFYKWYGEMTITILKNGKTSVKLITDTDEAFRAAAEAEYQKCLNKVRWYKYCQNKKKVEVSFVVRAQFFRNDQTIKIIK
jgi:hypothetical protein